MTASLVRPTAAYGTPDEQIDEILTALPCAGGCWR